MQFSSTPALIFSLSAGGKISSGSHSHSYIVEYASVANSLLSYLVADMFTSIISSHSSAAGSSAFGIITHFGAVISTSAVKLSSSPSMSIIWLKGMLNLMASGGLPPPSFGRYSRLTSASPFVISLPGIIFCSPFLTFTSHRTTLPKGGLPAGSSISSITVIRLADVSRLAGNTADTFFVCTPPP